MLFFNYVYYNTLIVSCQEVFFTGHKKTQHLAGLKKFLIALYLWFGSYALPNCSTAPYICVHAVLGVDRRFATIPIARCNTGWLALCSSCVYLPQGGFASSFSTHRAFLTGSLLILFPLAWEYIAYCVGREVFPHAIS